MFNHITVLSHQLVNSLNLSTGDISVDCTSGGGGHTQLMLNQVASNGKVFGFDRDPIAIQHLKERFQQTSNLHLIQNTFSSLGDELQHLKGKIQGIGADLGVSSPQLDEGERGFSFSHDGPLDMRMSSEGENAADFLATVHVSDLARILHKYGEEPRALRIAKAIAREREHTPFTHTKQLADFVERASGYHQSRTHPATRTFQAIRIHLNGELDEVSALIQNGWDLLRKGGRMAIITFHSLEDRIVKHEFKRLAAPPKLPKNLPLTQEEIAERFPLAGNIVKPFPIKPTDEEISHNPRARSAKLRVIEKL